MAGPLPICYDPPAVWKRLIRPGGDLLILLALGLVVVQFHFLVSGGLQSVLPVSRVDDAVALQGRDPSVPRHQRGAAPPPGSPGGGGRPGEPGGPMPGEDPPPPGDSMAGGPDAGGIPVAFGENAPRSLEGRQAPGGPPGSPEGGPPPGPPPESLPRPVNPPGVPPPPVTPPRGVPPPFAAPRKPPAPGRPADPAPLPAEPPKVRPAQPSRQNVPPPARPARPVQPVQPVQPAQPAQPVRRVVPPVASRPAWPARPPVRPPQPATRPSRMNPPPGGGARGSDPYRQVLLSIYHLEKQGGRYALTPAQARRLLDLVQKMEGLKGAVPDTQRELLGVLTAEQLEFLRARIAQASARGQKFPPQSMDQYAQEALELLPPGGSR